MIISSLYSPPVAPGNGK